jgi:hypothetical protein
MDNNAGKLTEKSLLRWRQRLHAFLGRERAKKAAKKAAELRDPGLANAQDLLALDHSLTEVSVRG